MISDTVGTTTSTTPVEPPLPICPLPTHLFHLSGKDLPSPAEPAAHPKVYPSPRRKMRGGRKTRMT